MSPHSGPSLVARTEAGIVAQPLAPDLSDLLKWLETLSKWLPFAEFSVCPDGWPVLAEEPKPD